MAADLCLLIFFSGPARVDDRSVQTTTTTTNNMQMSITNEEHLSPSPTCTPDPMETPLSEISVGSDIATEIQGKSCFACFLSMAVSNIPTPKLL